MAYLRPNLLRDAVATLNSYNPNTFLLLVFGKQLAEGVGPQLEGNVRAVSAVYNELFYAERVEFSDPERKLFVQVCFDEKENNSVKIRLRTDYGKAYQRTIKDTFGNGKFLKREAPGVYSLTPDFVAQVRAYLGHERLDLRPLLLFLNWNSLAPGTNVAELWNPFAAAYGLLTSPLNDVFYCSGTADFIELVEEPYSFEDYVTVLVSGGEAEAAPAQPALTPTAPLPAYPRARLRYGAPGTGKSHLLEQEAQAHFAGRYTRVTFHADYSFAQFVGGYRPQSQYLDEGTGVYHPANAPGPAPGTYARRPILDYVAVPGPLLHLLARAYQDPAHGYLLLVEELNRADAAAVFGDLFQLLDRDPATGASAYAVALPAELGQWLRAQALPAVPAALLAVAPGGEVSIRLPANLYIWATMNSADQGVRPLDAAFKRRWAFEYVPLNHYRAVTAAWPARLLGRAVGWNPLRECLNRYLLRPASGGGRAAVPEDRLLGPFFMARAELADNRAVLHKLLLYLRDDLARHQPGLLFAPGCLHLSDLHAQYLRRSEAAGRPAPDTPEAFAADLAAVFAPELAAALAPLYGTAPADADAAPAAATDPATDPANAPADAAA